MEPRLPYRWPRSAIPISVPLVCLLACGGPPQPAAAVQAHTTVQQAAPLALSATLEALPPGVTAEPTLCTPASSDSCNGRDDDCDGRIDEGCGWETGPVQITLAWDGGADLDLYVTEPSGFTISYLDRTSPGGGTLDHDARGACIPGGETIENVYWAAERPPSGSYRVELHYWGDCGVAGPTSARVAVSVAGRVIGTYDVVLELGQRRTVVAFRL